MRFGRTGQDLRGQGLVEFALILPLLALLMVMALDFGRVFFGWVALENASRVAADFAAKNYDAWTTPDEPIKQLTRERYETLVASDAEAINCTLASLEAPEFSNASTGAAVDPPNTGDHATVKLDCHMTLLTPLANMVLGGGVDLSANADFAVHKPETIKLPEVETPPPPPGCDTGQARVPDLTFKTMQVAWDSWAASGFSSAKFTPELVASGPGNNKNKIVQTQNPVANECRSTTDGTMQVTLP